MFLGKLIGQKLWYKRKKRLNQKNMEQRRLGLGAIIRRKGIKFIYINHFYKRLHSC